MVVLITVSSEGPDTAHLYFFGHRSFRSMINEISEGGKESGLIITLSRYSHSVTQI